MNNDDKLKKRYEQIKNKEEEYYTAIAVKLSYLRDEYDELIKHIEFNVNNMGHQQPPIKNASVTVNNKLIELNNAFKEKGLSLYASYNEDLDIVGHSLVGEALITDLMMKLDQADEYLKSYAEALINVCLNFNKRYNSAFGRALYRLNPFTDDLLKEGEHQILDERLQKYIDADDEIWQYTIEDNLVNAIALCVKRAKKELSADKIPYMLNKCMAPEIKQLGFEKLIPQIEEELIKIYEADVDLEQIDEHERYLYVPDFTHNYDEDEWLSKKQEDVKESSSEMTEEEKYRTIIIDAIVDEMLEANLCKAELVDVIKNRLRMETTADLQRMLLVLAQNRLQNNQHKRTRGPKE